MKRISILLCSEEEAADTFTFLRGERRSSCQQRASIAREIAFPRHQSCSEEDAEDSFAVDNFVMQLTSNIDSEEKVKI